MKKYINHIIFVLILVVIAAVFYFSRQIFFYKYEPEYFENWYYHSQWNYPNSTRGISDGPLYQFVGYRLVQGENPFNINFEMPPFGKYLYGLAAMYLGNPHWTSIFLYLSSVVVLFLLAKELFKNRQIILLSLFLFVTTPFVATQVRETMLDLPLTFLYLVHTWFFIKFLSNKNFANLIASGIFLGLATATKPGVYTPPAVLLGLLLIFFVARRGAISLFELFPLRERFLKTKNRKSLILPKKFIDLIFYAGSVFAGYVLAYFPTYFIRHPNPIPWLRLHEKGLKFYLAPGQVGQVDYLNQWKGIFLKTYEGWWGAGEKIGMGDWSLVLPLGVISLILILIWAIRNGKNQWVYIAGLSSVFLIVNTFIPFWPRYLMPAIPLFVLLITYIFRKAGVVLFFLALLNLPFVNTSMNDQNPKGDMGAAARFISTRAYRELYRSITPQDRNNIPEEEFMELNENFFEKLGTRNIEVTVEDVERKGKNAQAKFKLVYDTKYGKASHESTFEYRRGHNQWKIVWQWDYLWPGYGPESKILVEGTSKDVRKMVYVIPRLMFDWGKHLSALSEVVGENTGQIDQKIRRVVPDKYPRFTGYLNPALGSEGKKKVLEIPGGSLVDDDSSPQVKIYVLSGGGARFEIPIEYEEKD